MEHGLSVINKQSVHEDRDQFVLAQSKDLSPEMLAMMSPVSCLCLSVT